MYEPLFCILLHNDGTVDDGIGHGVRGETDEWEGGTDGCRDKTVQKERG